MRRLVAFPFADGLLDLRHLSQPQSRRQLLVIRRGVAAISRTVAGAGESAPTRLHRILHDDDAQWFETTKNQDVSTGPLDCPFTYSILPLTHLLAPHCLLCLRAPLRSFICSLAHFAHSRAHGKVND